MNVNQNFLDDDRLKKVNKSLIQYNLQLFADSGSGEKTEEPTAKRKRKAREEGQVAKSTEITTALMLILTFTMLKYYGSSVIDRLLKLMQEVYPLFSNKEVSIRFFSELIGHAITELIWIILPILILTFAIALISNVMQVGLHISTKPLQPKLSNFNPVQGVKKIISMKSLVELGKSLLKVGVIGVIVFMSIKDYDVLLTTIYQLSFIDAYKKIVDICFDIAIKIGGFFIFIAILDYAYQRYSLNKKLKMTKQEIKEEFKQAEGNPEIKSKIRQKMREAAMRRMMQDLPSADVIITNPTHFAVAIKYNPTDPNSRAPEVIAKGADLVAARIREVAKENNIEIVENKPLARTLYYTVEIGEEIPPELYQAVAEILAFVFSLNNPSSVNSFG